jgi:ABC-type multidrug transport system fused ATPase/permease subunit
MTSLGRCFYDARRLWRAWAPVMLIAALLPLAGVAMPLVQKQLVDGVILAGRLDLLPETVAVYCGLWLLSLLGGVAGNGLGAYLNERVLLDLRQRLFEQTAYLSLAFSRREHSGRTLSLFVNDAPNVATIFGSSVSVLVGSLVAMIAGAVAMFSLSWQLAVVAGVAPPLVAGVAAILTRSLRPASRRAQEKAAELNERVTEQLNGIREVLAFGQEHRQAVGFARTLAELLRLRMRVTLVGLGMGVGQSLFSLSVTLVILGYGGWLVIHGQATLGTLLAMQSLFGLVFTPSGQMVGLISGIQKSLASADRVYAFLALTPRVREKPEARSLINPLGRIRFEDVSFAYEPGRSVLQHVSFTAMPGETIALVGPSGAGKSTLTSLIPRFYDAGTGRVLLDDVDVRELSLAGLRSQIGIVFQDTFLFAGSVRDNITLGRPGSSDAEILAAARAAHAVEFIDHLHEGLETQIGERGAQLSEGQRQRLAIARALLRNPRILILDEPTSALDARSERLLQAALENLTRDRTTFIIAHRLATVRRADRILVLDQGRIVEQGTHHELIDNAGLYRDLYDLQFGVVNGSDTSHATSSDTGLRAHG